MSDINNTQKNKIIFYVQKYKFFILTIFLLLIVSSATGYYVLNKNLLNLNNVSIDNLDAQNTQKQNQYVIRDVSLSDEQKKLIYKKVLSRNNLTLDNVSTKSIVKDADLKNTLSSIIGRGVMADTPDGFSKTIYEYIKGQRQCKSLYNLDDPYSVSKWTSLNYVDKDKKYYKNYYQHP